MQQMTQVPTDNTAQHPAPEHRRPRTLRRLLAACGLGCGLGLLAACSSLPPAIQSALGVRPEPSQFTATRSELAAAGITQSLIKVSQEIPQPQSAGFLVIARANGVQFYQANDGAQILLAGGLLRATVGLQNTDLEGADTAPVARALASRGGSYRRTLRHRRGEGQVFETEVICRLSAEGQETITIVGRSHPTTRYLERCRADQSDAAGRSLAFDNRYWQGGGVIWASEQWVSYEAESIRIEQVLR